MPANLTSKPPDTPPGKPTENKFDPFRPDMPQIPGVGQDSRQAPSGFSGMNTQLLLQIGGIAAAVVLFVGLIFWWFRGNPRGTSESASVETGAAEQTPATPALPNPIPAIHEGPTVAATVEELSRPWASKKFTYINPLTQEHVAAMVIRLPSGGLWAFSLAGPFGRCELEFVSDLATLASKYAYTASHPMVVNPCDNTVYDPLKVGALGGNTWVRGEIVQGSALRPPIAIDVKVRGRSIVADSIE
jgi:hypothetical protein